MIQESKMYNSDLFQHVILHEVTFIKMYTITLIQ